MADYLVEILSPPGNCEIPTALPLPGR